MDRDEDEFLLSQLLSDEITKHTSFDCERDGNVDDVRRDAAVNPNEISYQDENDDSTNALGFHYSTTGDILQTVLPRIGVDEFPLDGMDDYFFRTVKRLENNDPTLQSIELCNNMLWDYDRWRLPIKSEDEQGEESYTLDVEAWLNSIALLLRLVQRNSQIVKLDFTNIPINHPTIVSAIIAVLTCDERTWLQWTIEECEGFDARFLADAMTASTASITLRSLRLINASFSPEGMTDVGRIVSTSTSLTELRLTENLDTSAIINLSKGLEDNHTITRLDFQGSSFPDDSNSAVSVVGALAVVLRGLRNLLTLSFAYCGISDHQLTTIIHILGKHKTLSWLDLTRNDCGLETCHALAHLLLDDESSAGCKLNGLTMNGCGVGDLGLVILQSALSTPQCTLKHLHLTDNRISDDGIVGFLEKLPDNPSLCSLWLSGNDFGDRGAAAILKTIHENHYLEEVVLDSWTTGFREIKYFALLNRGGRRLLQTDQNKVPLGLWPLVLERAQRPQHFTREASAPDILYHLLQGPALSK